MARHEAEVFRVDEKTAKQTVAGALRFWLGDKSWAEVRALVASRRVQIDGNLCLDSARRLNLGETLRICPQPLPKPPSADELKLRYLDEHLLVVEKPAGVTTVRHPEERRWPSDRKQLQPTLDELLPKLLQRESGRHRTGPRYPRVRAVHRLDRDTSGLMVFARTVTAERGLVAQFKHHSIHRLYRAIVAGSMKHEQTFDSVLVRDRGDGRRGSSTNSKAVGKRAITHVKPIDRAGYCTLVECKLETGRTHQIRIHLAEAGFPVLGEKVYTAARDGGSAPNLPKPGRILLHAAELGFQHPVTGEAMNFVMPLPADIQAVWDQLQQNKT